MTDAPAPDTLKGVAAIQFASYHRNESRQMQIAIIGWGSLIWCPGSLKLATRWHRDGPLLPVEFARISKDGRLTLVIHADSREQPTLWAFGGSDDIGEVRENLRQREGTNLASIHRGTVEGEYSEGVADNIQQAIVEWLSNRPQIKGCVWTGLGSNWNEKRRCEFSVEDALRHLTALQEGERAREYIQNAPSQIQTEARAAIRTQLRWSDAELSPVLFENG